MHTMCIYRCVYIYLYILCMLVYMFIFAVTGTQLTSWWRETIYFVPFWMRFWILSFTGGGVVVVSAGRSCLVTLADCYYESSMHNAHTRSYSDSWCVYDILWIDRCTYKYICTYIYIHIYIYVCIALYHHPWTPAFQDSPYTRWSSSTVAIFSMNLVVKRWALEIALNFKGKEESLPSIIVFEGGDSC